MPFGKFFFYLAVLPVSSVSTIPTNAPYPFIHLPPTLYNVSLPVLQVSPVSNIPPMLHAHSFTYHPRYIMFLSQYCRFPLSVPFHQCSVPIHSPTTHTIKYLSPSTSVFPCQYHSTNAPYPFIHLPPTLYVSLPILQFSPVSTISPMLHTHPFTYHPHYMFLSQYFSFPCQYHFTNAPYPSIHLPPTLYVSLPVLQFSPVSTIPPMFNNHFNLNPVLI